MNKNKKKNFRRQTKIVDFNHLTVIQMIVYIRNLNVECLSVTMNVK